jgi:hypothetical protein
MNEMVDRVALAIIGVRGLCEPESLPKCPARACDCRNEARAAIEAVADHCRQHAPHKDDWWSEICNALTEPKSPESDPDRAGPASN